MTNSTYDPFVTLTPDELALVDGGFGLDTLQHARDAAIGATRNAYRWGVKEVTADIGGWKLANQLFGTPQQGSTWNEKLAARSALKNLLNSSDRLPTWAPNW